MRSIKQFLTVNLELVQLRFLVFDVQDLQDEVAKESEELQRLQAQRQKVQQALEELDQQRDSLEEQLTHIRQQTNQETQLVGSVEVWLVDQLKVVPFKHIPAFPRVFCNPDTSVTDFLTRDAA